MDKEQIHAKLVSVQTGKIDSVEINEEDFIESYGENQTRKINGEQLNRPMALARVHFLDIKKNDANKSYIFTRKGD